MKPIQLQMRIAHFALACASTGLGIFLGSIVASGIFKLLDLVNLPDPSNSSLFYWLSLIPLVLFIGCCILVYYTHFAGIRDFVNLPQFGFREFSLTILMSVAVVVGIQSLILMLAWLRVAMGH